MKLVEQAIHESESNNWLDEAITGFNQYKTFTSYKNIIQQLRFIGVKESKVQSIVKTVESLVGINNPLNEIRVIRNRIAHEDEILSGHQEVMLDSTQVTQYLNFVLKLVQNIHEVVIELN